MLLALEALETLFPWQQLGGPLHGQRSLDSAPPSLPLTEPGTWPQAQGWATRVTGFSIPHPSLSVT